MEQQKTPKPGEENYPVDRPQDLNIPRFNSATDKQDSSKQPPVENMNDQQKEIINTDHINDTSVPSPDLGNERGSKEDDRERIIRR